jgi:hypothetical protein
MNGWKIVFVSSIYPFMILCFSLFWRTKGKHFVRYGLERPVVVQRVQGANLGDP